jgi:hypothetical protein
MSTTVIYSWESAYVSAVLETDPGKISERILETLYAMEERFLNPDEIGRAELNAMAAAQFALFTLKTEWGSIRPVEVGEPVEHAAAALHI